MYTTLETRSNLDIFPGTLDLKIREWLMTGGDTGSISTIFGIGTGIWFGHF